MIDNKTIREVVISDKLFPGGSGEPTYDTRTASGDIATFNTNVVKPLKSLTAQIVPIQEGTGDPSPSNPRPISGTSVLNVEQRGKNLVAFSATTITTQQRILDNVFLKAGNYVFSIDLKDTTNIAGSFNIRIGTTSIGTVGFNGGYDGRIEKAFTLANDSSINIVLGGSVAGYSYSISNCQIEIGSTPTTYSPYTGSTYPIALGRTVYGASVDVVEGEGDETYGYIASYNGEEINEPWISSIDPYVQGTTPSTGAEVVYPLSTPIDFTFTGQEINSLLGVNNVWTDTGDTEVSYLYQTGTEPTSKVNKWLPIFYPIRKGDT